MQKDSHHVVKELDGLIVEWFLELKVCRTSYLHKKQTNGMKKTYEEQ